MLSHDVWIDLPQNRAARLSIERVCACLVSRKRRCLNPLFLYGPAGVGKSLLIQRLLSQLSHSLPECVFLILSAADLALRTDADHADDEAALQRADVIVLEDVQHLHVRDQLRLTFLVDRAIVRQRQVVLTGNQGPAALALPARLASRLAQGLVVGMELLDRSARCDFLSQSAQHSALSLSDESISWLADHIGGSPRRLAGALTRLQNLQAINGNQPLDLSTIQTTFTEEGQSARADIDRIARQVARWYRVEPKDLRSARRSREVMLPRQVSMYLARQLTTLSLVQIGEWFGGRDHTTVLHACRKVEESLTQDAELDMAVRSLQAELR
jgi:chromosomal replication initiator protein